MRHHARSFYFATRFLPRRKREAVEAAYAVFRVADEFADAPGLSESVREAGLAAIASAVQEIRDPDVRCSEPWFAALRDAFSRFALSVDDALQLVAGCRGDLNGVSCETMDDLRRYAVAVGGTIMRFAMPVLGATDDDSLARAQRLGMALYLTDVVRDVEEDRRMGRNYLPREFAAMPDGGRANVTAEARSLYREAPALAKRLPNDGSRLAILVTSSLYEGMLDGPLTFREKMRRCSSCILQSYRV